MAPYGPGQKEGTRMCSNQCASTSEILEVMSAKTTHMRRPGVVPSPTVSGGGPPLVG